MLIFKDLLHPPLEKVIFAFERGYITSEVRNSMLDILVPGSFRNIGHQIEANKAGSNQVKIEEAQLKISSHTATVHRMWTKNGQRTMMM